MKRNRNASTNTFQSRVVVRRTIQGLAQTEEHHGGNVRYCFNKVINIANMGESALKSHAKSVKHQMRSPKPSTVPVTSPRTDNTSPTTSMSATTMSNVPTTSSTATPSTSLLQTRIVDTLIKDGVLLAEMRWCPNVVMQKSSFRSCDSMGLYVP